ncbi:PREDICTED: kelch-like protein 8 [Priapulus caudatus]|uniref:Kelch-like protein 8 n=1 Tax=Priapulus caudatus TaxID=37621 RepID=A0ABM1EL09_PRICU|nr:PREDICTED: kelch-like protein 8 [Priapulus caudatus]
MVTITVTVTVTFTATITVTITVTIKVTITVTITRSRSRSRYMMTNLHPENCLGVRAFAERHQHYELIRAADQYTIDFFPDVTKSVEFTNVTGAHLLQIIASDELNIVTESVVYEAVMKWINFDLKARKDFLPVLMAKVRLPLIPAGYLVNNVAEDELLKSCLTCRDFVDEAKYFHMSLTGLVSTPRRSERTTCRKSFAGTIFVVGGRGASVEPLRSVECYDLRRDKWVNVPDIGSRRRHVGIAAAMGKIYAIGGHNGREHLNSAEVLDPRSGKWMKLSPMASRRWESIANMRTGRAGAGIASCDILFNEVVTSSFAEETMTRQRTLRHHTSAASLT